VKTPVVAVLALAVLAVAPAAVSAQATFSTGSSSFGSRLATPTGRANVGADAISGINAMSTRPKPASPGQPVVRPEMLWVPDRYVSVPGAPAGVLVPGHWERRVSDREVYAPPLAITHPQGEPGLIPGGFRPPAEERNSP
jgi:hypothetical protein